ncbi:MAG: RagB/SusD family nutrient uptake outer membrane protein [Candidatus Pedobacter colombiensis]|uniref:RagB/SusD family nutrient uptake outer membrane protein n=1 Tax=Candidatus Pedobacter colombiensis TaxID=3121371 RepID=A0AAJ5WBD7_9SPHI|nr:RagB/SusD family nutrient uptake outer membrane protein [Pedobacter sp.]WEK21486.1 MAG: RagB/SusD family nutrient uptake outer membrane protein [Pedobacter sp.]
MKTKIYYILAVLALMMNTSCKDYLMEESKTDIDKNKYMNNAAEAENVLLGVYRNMTTDELYGFNLSILFTMGTDISQVEGSTNENFRIIPTNSFTANQAEVQGTYAKLYNSVYNANDFIESLEQKMVNYSDADKRLATIYLAEAKGLRGLYYFELLRLYGHIALITNTAMSNQAPDTFVQEDPAKVYEFIEQDLKYAIDNLPYAVDDTYRSNKSFRLSKGSALGLLSKVYATWAGYPVRDVSKWEMAAKTAQILIQSNKHGLLDNYEQLWKNSGAGLWNPTESLIEVTFYSPTATNGSNDPIGRIGKWNGVKTTTSTDRGSNAGNMKVVHTFVLDWRNYPEDLRRDISVANYLYSPTKTLCAKGASDTEQLAIANDADPTKKQKEKQNYTPGKWDTEKYVPQSNKLINNDYSNVNWYILRYADVLLIYAEALNEWKQGPTPDAYTAVNMVRRRGYGLPIGTASALADLPAGLDVNGFRDAVHKERAFELAFEGDRKLDLIRWGIYYETVKDTAKKLGTWWITAGAPNYAVATPGYTTKGKHDLFPIPQREMDLTKFQQNFGW